MKVQKKIGVTESDEPSRGHRKKKQNREPQCNFSNNGLLVIRKPLYFKSFFCWLSEIKYLGNLTKRG